MQDTKDTILVFESKELCYHSSAYFLQEICRELVDIGIPVEYCKIESIEKQERQIVGYIGKTYRAIIDMNSTLALIFCDEYKDYLINLIHAPFYNIIVDHPMHMRDKLNVPLNNYNIICLDSYHAAYINKRYPHIKKIFVVHYAGLASKRILELESNNTYEVFQNDYEERPYSVLFPATYMPVYYYREELERVNTHYVNIAESMMEYIEQSECITFEEAYISVVKEDGSIYQEVTGDYLARKYGMRLIDRYIRTAMREHALEELLKTDRDIHVIGANWRMCPFTENKNLIIHEAVTYGQQLEYMERSKIVFNMQPLFLEGPHDRIMNGMRNGAVVITDRCHYISKRFIDGEDIVYYKRSSMEQIPEKLNSLFIDKELLSKIAWNGYGKVKNEHTWRNRVMEVLKNT